MKKLFTLTLTMALLVFSIATLDAQTPRKAMAELVTQASCPPCATNNPTTIATINANSDNAILMAYQVWWPGFDPMYLDNPEEVQDRVNYYGVNGAPTVTVQGTTDAGLNLGQAEVDAAIAGMSEFVLDLNAEVLDGTLYVTGMVTASMAASGDFRLRVALAEELITIDQAPGGTNGETEYHHVFKRFVGGSQGADLENEWAMGDTYEIDMSLPLGTTNIYSFGGLEVIAWIQNDADRFIHQAEKVSDVELISTTVNNGVAVSASGLAASYCTGENTITPVFRLQNGGSDNLTSADIVYNVNGGPDQTVNWTGDLPTLFAEDVALDAITFDNPAEGSTLNITVTNPNGVEDELQDDDAVVTALAPAAFYDGSIRLVLTTDNYGNETYWQMTDGMGNIIASGGNAGVGLTNTGVGAGAPPTDPGAYGNNQTITEDIPLPADGCYTFTITDYWGDGICCGFGQGSFNLLDPEGNVLLTGGEFTAQDDLPFEGAMLVNAQDVEFTAKFAVSPNPVVDVAQLAFTLETAEVTTVTVANNLGQVVRTQNLGKLPTGAHNLNVDMTGLAAGVYLINITSGDVSGTQKVIVASH